MSDFVAYGKLVKFSETVIEPVLRTDMERGLAKQRRTYTEDEWNINVTYIFTTAQYNSFVTWWRSTINHGSDWFNYEHPQTGATISTRIKLGTLNAIPVNARANAMSVTFTLEYYA